MAQQTGKKQLPESSGGGSSILLFLGGVLLLVSGLFSQPAWVDPLFRVLDFRLWPWWYFVLLLLIVGFSIKWFFLFQSWDDLAPTDLEVGKRFLRMSITISIELLIVALLNAVGLLRQLSYPLWSWFGYGSYSHMGALAFLLICISVGITIYVVREWFIAVAQS